MRRTLRFQLKFKFRLGTLPDVPINFDGPFLLSDCHLNRFVNIINMLLSLSSRHFAPLIGLFFLDWPISYFSSYPWSCTYLSISFISGRRVLMPSVSGHSSACQVCPWAHCHTGNHRQDHYQCDDDPQEHHPLHHTDGSGASSNKQGWKHQDQLHSGCKPATGGTIKFAMNVRNTF